MIRLISAAILTASLAIGAAIFFSSAAPPATCSGGKGCNACKNCRYCKHCAKEGGTCSVCR